jgi:hypothetical protein
MMSDPTDFTPDDVLGFEFDSDPVTGEETDVLTVTFKDGTERKFQGAEADRVRRILANSSPPSA